jgi:hypothetical protein
LKPGGKRQAAGHLAHFAVARGIGLLRASLKAATTRSSSICLSAGTIRLSSIDSE